MPQQEAHPGARQGCGRWLCPPTKKWAPQAPTDAQRMTRLVYGLRCRSSRGLWCAPGCARIARPAGLAASSKGIKSLSLQNWRYAAARGLDHHSGYVPLRQPVAAWGPLLRRRSGPQAVTDVTLAPRKRWVSLRSTHPTGILAQSQARALLNPHRRGCLRDRAALGCGAPRSGRSAGEA